MNEKQNFKHMKKIVLLLLVLPVFAFGQNLKKVQNANHYTAVENIISAVVNDVIPQHPPVLVPKEMEASKKILNRGSKYSFAQIGLSQYGLQTNAAIARRIVLYPGSKVSAVWTTSPNESPWLTRGSGYNHFNGSNWMPTVENRIESDRCGWPNIGSIKQGADDVEYVIAHFAPSSSLQSSGGFHFNINDAIGSTNWSETTKGKGTFPIWYRTAQSGDYIYLMGTYSDTNVFMNGMQSPTTFSRYKVSTGTWVDENILLPGYDTSLFKFGSADNYSIDAKDNVVAILLTPRLRPVTLWKSIDYGDTWEMTIVDSSSQPVSTPGDTIYYYYSDGTANVLIDNNLDVHGFYGTFRGYTMDDTAWYKRYEHGIFYFNELNATMDSTRKDVMIYKDTVAYRLLVDDQIVPSIHFMKNESYTYSYDPINKTIDSTLNPSFEIKVFNDVLNPTTVTQSITAWPTYYRYDTSGATLDSFLVAADSVIYQDSFIFEVVDQVITTWKKYKVFPNKKRIKETKVFDRNNDDSTNVENGWVYQRTGPDGVARNICSYGGTNFLTSFPSSTVDANGNLFLIYSSIVEEAYFVTGMSSGGDEIRENYKDVYVVYSSDNGQTWNGPQNITNNPEAENVFASVARDVDDNLHIVFQEDEDPGTVAQNYDDPTVNYIYYVQVPVADILNNEIGPGDLVGVKETSKAGFSIGNVYPNPFRDLTYVDITLKENANISVEVLNLLGQRVQYNTYNNLPAGDHQIAISANRLPSGVYLLKVSSDDHSLSQKLIIE
jgi:hypothetical protein